MTMEQANVQYEVMS